jgi:hypothetical protein
MPAVPWRTSADRHSPVKGLGVNPGLVADHRESTRASLPTYGARESRTLGCHFQGQDHSDSLPDTRILCRFAGVQRVDPERSQPAESGP